MPHTIHRCTSVSPVSAHGHSACVFHSSAHPPLPALQTGRAAVHGEQLTNAAVATGPRAVGAARARAPRLQLACRGLELTSSHNALPCSGWCYSSDREPRVSSVRASSVAGGAARRRRHLAVRSTRLRTTAAAPLPSERCRRARAGVITLHCSMLAFAEAACSNGVRVAHKTNDVATRK